MSLREVPPFPQSSSGNQNIGPATQLLYSYFRKGNPTETTELISETIVKSETQNICHKEVILRDIALLRNGKKPAVLESIHIEAELHCLDRENVLDFKEERLLLTLLSLIRSKGIVGVAVVVSKEFLLPIADSNGATSQREVVSSWSFTTEEEDEKLQWLSKTAYDMRKVSSKDVEFIIIPGEEDEEKHEKMILFVLRHIFGYRCKISSVVGLYDAKEIKMEATRQPSEEMAFEVALNKLQNEKRKRTEKKNVYVIGSMGAGKSTLINLMKDADEEKAFVSHDGVGTFHLSPFNSLNGSVLLWDTPGTNDEFNNDFINYKFVELKLNLLQNISALVVVSMKGRDLKDTENKMIKRYMEFFGQKIEKQLCLVIGVDKSDRNANVAEKKRRMISRFEIFGLNITEEQIFFIRAEYYATEVGIPSASLEEAKRLKLWLQSKESMYTKTFSALIRKLDLALTLKAGILDEDLFNEIKIMNKYFIQKFMENTQIFGHAKFYWEQTSFIVRYKQKSFEGYRVRTKEIFEARFYFNSIDDKNIIINKGIGLQGYPSSYTTSLRVQKILREIQNEGMVFILISNQHFNLGKTFLISHQYSIVRPGTKIKSFTWNKIKKIIDDELRLKQELGIVEMEMKNAEPPRMDGTS